MDPISRFTTVLKRGGIDLPRAQSILQEYVGDYPDDVVLRWLEGDVLPGLTIRGRLFEAATNDFEEIRWESETFMGELPPELLPPVQALCEAARHNDHDALLRRLSGGIVIDGWDEGFDYALGYATERRHHAIVESLLQWGAEPTTFAKGKQNAYRRALVSGSTEVLQRFVDLDARRRSSGSTDMSALMAVAAAEADNPDMIHLLHRNSPFDSSVLGLALLEAIAHRRLRSAEAIVEIGAAIDVRDPDRRTPLMRASLGGYEDLVAALVEAGAAFHLQDSEGNTALHHAVKSGHAGIVQRLSSEGADATLKNQAGETPRQLAQTGPDEVLDALGELSTPSGPSWLDPKGTAVMFVFNRGQGLGFDPRMRDEPILYGGDHFGVRHVSPSFMEGHASRAELETMGSAWFSAFIDKLRRREDFTLEELLEAARQAGQLPNPRPDIQPSRE